MNPTLKPAQAHRFADEVPADPVLVGARRHGRFFLAGHRSIAKVSGKATAAMAATV